MHIQILLYNSKKHIKSLIAGLNTLDQKIIVHFADNSNQDSDIDIKLANPNFEYTFYKSEENTGFGKGHNILFQRYSKDYGDFFFILNPDTIVFYNLLENFIKVDLSNVGVLECQQCPLEHPKEYNDKTFETKWASGAASFYNTKLYREIGGFDENIFMYCEDVDISWRIAENRFKIIHNPNMKVTHITQHLDISKDNSFERIHSVAGNAYLRFKYNSQRDAINYLSNLINDPYYKQEVELYNLMMSKLSEADASKYRKYKSPFFNFDFNYAEHRW